MSGRCVFQATFHSSIKPFFLLQLPSHIFWMFFRAFLFPLLIIAHPRVSLTENNILEKKNIILYFSAFLHAPYVSFTFLTTVVPVWFLRRVVGITILPTLLAELRGSHLFWCIFICSSVPHEIHRFYSEIKKCSEYIYLSVWLKIPNEKHVHVKRF